MTLVLRALKMHGGGPAVTPGTPLKQEYTEENLPLGTHTTNNRYFISVIIEH